MIEILLELKLIFSAVDQIRSSINFLKKSPPQFHLEHNALHYLEFYEFLTVSEPQNAGFRTLREELYSETELYP